MPPQLPQTALIGQNPYDPKKEIEQILSTRKEDVESDFPTSVISHAHTVLALSIPVSAVSAHNPCLFTLEDQSTVDPQLSRELMHLTGIFCYIMHDKALQGTMDNGVPKAVMLLKLLIKEPSPDLSKSSQTYGWTFFLFINTQDYSVSDRLQSLFVGPLQMPLSALGDAGGDDEEDDDEDISIEGRAKKRGGKKMQKKPPPRPLEAYNKEAAADAKFYRLNIRPPVLGVQTVGELARAVGVYTMDPGIEEMIVEALSKKEIIRGTKLDPSQFFSLRHAHICGAYTPLLSEDILNPPESAAAMIEKIPFHLQKQYLDLLDALRTSKYRELIHSEDDEVLEMDTGEQVWTPEEEGIINFFTERLQPDHAHLLPESSSSWGYILQSITPTAAESCDERVFQFPQGHSNYIWRLRGPAIKSFIAFYSLQLPMSINKPEVDPSLLRTLRNWKGGTHEELQRFCKAWTTSSRTQDSAILKQHIANNLEIEAKKKEQIALSIQANEAMRDDQKQEELKKLDQEFADYVDNRWQSFEPRLNSFASANGNCDPAIKKAFEYIETLVDEQNGTAFQLWENDSSDVTVSGLAVLRLYALFSLLGLNCNHEYALTVWLGVLTNSYPEDKNPCNFVLAGKKSSGKNFMIESVLSPLFFPGIFRKVDDESSKAAKGEDVNHNSTVILRDEAKTEDLGIPEKSKGRIGGVQCRAESLMKARLSDGKLFWEQCTPDPITNMPRQVVVVSKENATNIFLTNAPPEHFTEPILSRLVTVNIPGLDIQRNTYKDRISLNKRQVDKKCKRIRLLLALTYAAGQLQRLGMLEEVDDGWSKKLYSDMAREMQNMGFKDAMLPRNLHRLEKVHASIFLFSRVMWLFSSPDSPLKTPTGGVKWSLTNFKHLQGRLHGVDNQCAFLVGSLFNDRFLCNSQREAVIRRSLALCCQSPSVHQHSMGLNQSDTIMFDGFDDRVWGENGVEFEEEVSEEVLPPPRPAIAVPKWDQPLKPPFLSCLPSESDPLCHGEDFEQQKRGWMHKLEEVRKRNSKERLDQYRYLQANNYLKTINDETYILLMAACTTSENIHHILKLPLSQAIFRAEKKRKELIRPSQVELELHKLSEEPYPTQQIKESKSGGLEISNPYGENSKGVIMIPHPHLAGKNTCLALKLNTALTQTDNVSLSVLYKLMSPSFEDNGAFKYFTGKPCCLQCFQPQSFYHLNTERSTLKPPGYYIKRYLKANKIYSKHKHSVNTVASSKPSAKPFYPPCRQNNLQRGMRSLDLDRSNRKRTFSEI